MPGVGWGVGVGGDSVHRVALPEGWGGGGLMKFGASYLSSESRHHFSFLWFLDIYATCILCIQLCI